MWYAKKTKRYVRYAFIDIDICLLWPLESERYCLMWAVYPSASVHCCQCGLVWTLTNILNTINIRSLNDINIQQFRMCLCIVHSIFLMDTARLPISLTNDQFFPLGCSISNGKDIIQTLDIKEQLKLFHSPRAFWDLPLIVVHLSVHDFGVL